MPVDDLWIIDICGCVCKFNRSDSVIWLKKIIHPWVSGSGGLLDLPIWPTPIQEPIIAGPFGVPAPAVFLVYSFYIGLLYLRTVPLAMICICKGKIDESLFSCLYNKIVRKNKVFPFSLRLFPFSLKMFPFPPTLLKNSS